MTSKTPEYSARNPDYIADTRADFAKQAVNGLIGAELGSITPGECTIRLPHRPDLCQQHGYLHAGITTTIADNAAGYAALSLWPKGSGVVSVEFKINLLAPAIGDRFEARARVERSGGTLSVVRSEVFALRGTEETPVALMLATMYRIKPTA